MYTDYYKLTALPFQLTPDPRFFFGSSVHKKAMAHLTYGLNQGEGFIIVTGEVGAGKTTLVSYLLSTLDPAQYVAAKIVTTQLGGDDMLRMVAAAFGIDQEGVDKATLLSRIEAFLAASHDQGRRCLLVVDEAQNLSIQALEELRMLSNFQVDEQVPLQSFLLGQPQFRNLLAQKALDQLRQRVIAHFHMGPLSPDETRAYVEHRLKTAGWTDDPEITPAAFDEIYRHTDGVPRMINTICSRLLLYGFLEERHRLDHEAVIQVAEDLRHEEAQVVEQSPDEPEAAAVAEPDGRAERRANGSGYHALRNAPEEGPRNGQNADYAELLRRLGVIEECVRRHDRMIQRALKIATDFLEAQK